MKLLFDQNLSPYLVGRIADLFPESNHVHWLGMGTMPDVEVWNYARQNGFTIVTKDADFSDLSALRGFPPQVIWLRLGNSTTAQIEVLLRAHHQDIIEMSADEKIGTLILVK